MNFTSHIGKCILIAIDKCMLSRFLKRSSQENKATTQTAAISVSGKFKNCLEIRLHQLVKETLKTKPQLKKLPDPKLTPIIYR